MFKRLLEITEPVISNQKLWRIINEFEKLVKSRLPVGNSILSTEIFGTPQNTESKGSSFFADALVITKVPKKNFI